MPLGERHTSLRMTAFKKSLRMTAFKKSLRMTAFKKSLRMTAFKKSLRMTDFAGERSGLGARLVSDLSRDRRFHKFFG